MLIYTASWSTKLPDNFKRIGISRGSPRGQGAGYRMYKKLAPGSWFMSVDVHEYRRRYMEILGTLDPSQVIEDLVALADGKTPALLCFEDSKPNDKWCHRGYVSVWLEERLGLLVEEYGQGGSWGWGHPKIPPEFRQQMTAELPL